MERYTLSVSDRNYSEWSIKPEICEESTLIPPLSLFKISEDILTKLDFFHVF